MMAVDGAAQPGSSARVSTALQVGDRVVFVREANPLCASDDPLYEPTIPVGATAIVIKIGADHLRVRMDDPSIAAEPVRLWEDGAFPDLGTNTVGSVRKLTDRPSA